jgi:hypothetical protein
MAMLTSKLALPVSDPLFNGERKISWSAEQVKMVRHNQVIADQPRGCFLPRLMQKLLDGFIGQPRFAMLRVDGEENEIGSPQLNAHTRRWILRPGSENEASLLMLSLLLFGDSIESKPQTWWGESPLEP